MAQSSSSRAFRAVAGIGGAAGRRQSSDYGTPTKRELAGFRTAYHDFQREHGCESRAMPRPRFGKPTSFKPCPRGSRRRFWPVAFVRGLERIGDQAKVTDFLGLTAEEVEARLAGDAAFAEACTQALAAFVTRTTDRKQRLAVARAAREAAGHRFEPRLRAGPDYRVMTHHGA